MPPTHHKPSHVDDVPDSFGLGGESDEWMERVREAETPATLGCVGPYELIEEVSRGGQGIVYRARQPGTKREIAVKRLLAGSFATPAMLRRFEREVELAASLNHPNIVTVFGIEIVDGQPLLAMEWIDGVPINEWATSGESGRRSPKQIASMMHDVCDAVRHAHQHGVIHRDLKPTNILVDQSGVPRVLDFGLARPITTEAEGGHAVTLTEQFVGTPAYASPEHLRSVTSAVDVRSDVYSLGLVLYNALTGTLPYDVTGDLPDVFQRIEHTEPRRPSSFSPHLDREIESIVLKALVKEKEGRYQSVDLLAEDLRCYVHGEPVSAHPPSAFYQVRKTVRRHCWPVAFIAVLFALVTGSAVWMSVLYGRARLAERQAATEAETAKQASAFLSDLFTVSDPFADPDSIQSLGETVTARELLDKGAERITAELAERPAVQAKLMGTIGNVYRNLGLYDRAEPLLEEALVLRRRVYGAEHAEVADSLRALGILRREQGDHEEAVQLLRDALAMYLRVLGNENIATADCMLTLGQALQFAGDFKAATPLVLESSALHRRLLGDNDRKVAVALKITAFVLLEQGDPEAAEPLCRDALAICRRILGDEHPETARMMSDLALVLNQKGDVAAAEELCREALARYRRLLGNEHPETAKTLHNLAGLLHGKGDLQEAEARYREALRIKRNVLGNEHPSIARSLLHLGAVLQDKGEYDQAESLYREALDMRRGLLGEEHRDVAAAMRNLSLVLDRKGEHEAAESLMRDAMEMQRRVLGDKHHVVAETQSMLAVMLAQRGDHASAEPLFQRALVIYREALGDESRATLQVMNDRGESLMRQRRVDEAEPLFAEVLETRRRVLGDDHPETLTSLANMGWVFWSRGNLRDAAPFYRQTMEGRLRVLGENHPHTLLVMEQYRTLQKNRGRTTEADELDRRIREIRSRTTPGT